MANAAQTQTPGASQNTDDFFNQLLTKDLRLKSEEEKTAVRSYVATLVESALQGETALSADATKTIKAIIAQIDDKISQQLNLIMHHPDFQQLEGAWRGLYHLVSNTETDTMLKIRVLNISKKEAAKSLDKFRGATWDQSPLFKKIYGAEFDMLGGTPYGCLVGDFQIENTPGDMKFMEDMAKIASAAHAPFITAADSSMLGLDDWTELQNPSDLAKKQDNPAFAAWRAFRNTEDAAYTGLTLPRFLGRLPYGHKAKNPTEGFDFEEETDGTDHSKYLWCNSAYAMAANITRSHKLYGWSSMINGVESGGTVEGLPCHTFPSDDGGVDQKCPTEIGIGDRREKELADLGFMPLIHRKGTTEATFIGAQSAFKPAKYQGKDGDFATANANLTARLTYMFPVCRFAHYLKVMVRDKIGSFKERKDMEKWLNDWITNYVTQDDNASDSVKAQYPLREASVEVQDVPGNPGYYAAKFFLRPHFKLEGLNTSLRLVSRLPAKG